MIEPVQAAVLEGLRESVAALTARYADMSPPVRSAGPGSDRFHAALEVVTSAPWTAADVVRGDAVVCAALAQLCDEFNVAIVEAEGFAMGMMLVAEHLLDRLVEQGTSHDDLLRDLGIWAADATLHR
jgi:hypothetical protein